MHNTVDFVGRRAPPPIGACPDPAKRMATLRAELAMRGVALLDNVHAGGYTACRWALSVDLADMAAVEAFVRRVGVTA